MVKIEQVLAEQVWPIRHAVMYPDMDFLSIKLPEDKQGIHLGLFENNKLISIVSLFKKDRDLQFRKFATLQAYQCKGYGSQLLQYIIQYAKAEGASRLWCNARRNAVGFYKKFGFCETNSTFFKDGYHFVVMEQYYL